MGLFCMPSIPRVGARSPSGETASPCPCWLVRTNHAQPELGSIPLTSLWVSWGPSDRGEIRWEGPWVGQEGGHAMLSGRGPWAAMHIHEALQEPLLDHASMETAKRWCCLHFTHLKQRHQEASGRTEWSGTWGLKLHCLGSSSSSAIDLLTIWLIYLPALTFISFCINWGQVGVL